MRSINLLVLAALTIFSCDQLKRKHSTKKAASSVNSLHFVEYNSFEASYKRNSDLKKLNNSYDFKWILLLDSTYADTIYKFDQKLREEVHDALLVCKPNEQTIGFLTEARNLKALLRDREGKEFIFRCTLSETTGPNPDNLADMVYINDNTAIIKIENSTSYSVYYITLKDQTVQLNLLESLIE